MLLIQKKKRTFRSFFKCLFFALVCVSLTGCDLARNYTKPDRAANMEIQDYRDGLAERLPETDKENTRNKVGIPELQPYVSTSTENISPMPLVSVSVNQSIPIKDVLFELAEQAEYDLELDPNISGSIIFTARNKPFDVVIDRISDIAGLRYEFNKDFLRVELDTPYNKVYKVDYLSFIRNNEGSVSTNVSVVSGDGADTGSA
ncbi:MAG: type II and III secretion system family protein, partial [Alphaproteobacteria bacterium]|nr:type II and III secretion system family protein [Alphaproteobacteria bacterium]